MRLSYFFSKKECILAILEGLIFKILWPVGPNHGGASLVTEPQPPQSQKCGHAPVLFLIYVNNLHKASSILKPVMFADDTNLFLSDKDINKLFNDINVELQKCQFGLRQISSL